ncbi:MAG: flagellar biosynthetic protein FliR [Burkholderiaceae bacterium]
MVQFSEAQLLAWLAASLYPFFRIAALIGTAPIIGDATVPRRVRIGLALFVTVVVAPGVSAVPDVALLSGEGFVLIVRQMLIGAAMGFSMRLAFAAIEYAGDLIGLQMGLGFALLIDPETRDQTPMIGSLLRYFASLAFLAANGPLMMIAGVADSFQSLPIAGSAGLFGDWKMLTLQGSLVFGLALHMALPVIAALLVTNVALGVMTRAAPQLNLFSIGFPITISVGLIVLIVSLPVMLAIADSALMQTAGRLLR